MKELFLFLFLIFSIVGEITIIATVFKDKNFTKLKIAFISVYLFIGINIPIVLYIFLTYKLQKQIPILSLGITFYEWGIFLIGVTSILIPSLKFIKNEFFPFFTGKGTTKNS